MEKAIKLNNIPISDNFAKLKAYYYQENIKEAPLNSSLFFLSELLYNFFNERKVFILIDEYDQIITNLIRNFLFIVVYFVSTTNLFLHYYYFFDLINVL